MTTEGWKDVPGYEGLYRVSDRGNVYSYSSQIYIIPWINNRGYLCVKLYKKGCRREYKIHQLVLRTFSPDGETRIKNEVHHIDEDKLNNCLDNLMWCSRKKNMKYMHESKRNKKAETITGPF